MATTQNYHLIIDFNVSLVVMFSPLSLMDVPFGAILHYLSVFNSSRTSGGLRNKPSDDLI